MARGVNKVFLIGHLGNDPELRYTPSGVAVATFSIATNERWPDKEGNFQEHTEWHRVVAWRKLAEICGEYLKKGSQIFVEGKLRTRNWEDQNGVKRYQTEVIIRDMQMLGKRDDTSSASSSLPKEDFADEDFPPENTENADNDLPF